MLHSEWLNLDGVRIDSALALRVPEALGLRRRVLVFGEDERGVHAACDDPEDYVALEALERAFGRPVLAVRAEPESLGRALQRVAAGRGETGEDGREDAVSLVDDLLRSAVLEQASDIHLEPDPQGMRVRFRVDGQLEERSHLASGQLVGLINRLKVLAGMDIAERRLPQDGRFTHLSGRGRGARAIDVRAAVLPTRHGERMALRLLAVQARPPSIDTLGLGANERAHLEGALAAQHGLVLLTGPTGSGKTTTLYAALRSLDLPRLNVLTIEDPIEYEVPGVSQVEVDSGDRITFARALRSALRHDPDVLMIGEIRDLETAEVAVRAALTGHLVLSTLHTNSAVGAITRLLDLGIPPYLAAATLRLVVAQRLVRRLCPHCRRPRPLGALEARALGSSAEAGSVAHVAVGCARCKRTGFSGRSGLFECFHLDEAARRLVAQGTDEDVLAAAARERGLHELRDDARAKVAAGETTPDEALRAVEAG